jgi:hypothetical protein
MVGYANDQFPLITSQSSVILRCLCCRLLLRCKSCVTSRGLTPTIGRRFQRRWTAFDNELYLNLRWNKEFNPYFILIKYKMRTIVIMVVFLTSSGVKWYLLDGTIHFRSILSVREGAIIRASPNINKVKITRRNLPLFLLKGLVRGL